MSAPPTVRSFALVAAVGALAVAGCRHTPDADPAAEMRHQHDGDTPVASGAAHGADTLDVTETRVAYAAVGGRPVEGVLVRPAGVDEPLPGVVVIHEWWGLNDNVVEMTRRIAAEGYAALAVDLYGGESAATPDEAMALMRAATAAPDALTANLEGAYSFLAEREMAGRVAALGWCFGGGQALQAALALPTQLAAVVVYYGQPVTDAERLAALQMPVLGLFGGADSSIPADTVRAFDRALSAAGVEHEVVVYPGAAHAFANPSGERYDATAAEAAWRRTTAFLAEHLKEAGTEPAE